MKLKSDSELLEMCMSIISNREEHCLTKEEIEDRYEYEMTHCKDCGIEYDRDYLANWGRCMKCYGKMVCADGCY